jgi:ubiquinone biosynthesis protein COQ9
MENSGINLVQAKESVLDAALSHVVFDGWSEATLKAAAAEAGVAADLVRVLFPRGPLDLAIAYHKRGDAAMVARLATSHLAAMRYRDRVAAAVRFRLEAADPEIVRRGTAFFALPQNMAAGAKLIWDTADTIWHTLGDTSQDLNWYSKRATLAAVYSSTVLYWLGDQSENHWETWAFLDRRIEDVMRFEKAKERFRGSFLGKALAGPLKVLDRVRAPAPAPADLPGREG